MESTVPTKEDDVKTEAGRYWQRLEGQTRARSTLPMLLCLLVGGMAACELFLFGGPYGFMPLFFMAFFCPLSLLYFSRRKGAFRPAACLWLLPVALLSVSYLYNNSVFTNWLTLPVLAVITALFLLDASGACGYRFYETGVAKAGVRLFFSLTGSALLKPVAAVRVRCAGIKKKKSPVFYGIAGLLAALPFLVIFLALFSNADSVFADGVKRVLDGINAEAVLHFVADVLVGLLACLYLGALLMVLRSAQAFRPQVKKREGRLHPAAISAFLFALILLEGLFCAVQFRYLFGGGRLPEGTTYAEYARSGFFSIAVASILTVAIIAVVSFITKKGKHGLPLPVKLLLTLFSVCVALLYASAFYRMGLYMNVYGLSVRRVMVCWLMALLAVLLLGVLFKVWKPQAKLTAFLIFTVLSMTVLLGALRVDALVARSNVRQYIAHPHEVQLDVSYLGSLSVDAMLYLEELIGTPMEQDAKEAMGKIGRRLESKTWRSWSPGVQKAQNIIKERQITWEDEWEDDVEEAYAPQTGDDNVTESVY